MSKDAGSDSSFVRPLMVSQDAGRGRVGMAWWDSGRKWSHDSEERHKTEVRVEAEGKHLRCDVYELVAGGV